MRGRAAQAPRSMAIAIMWVKIFLLGLILFMPFILSPDVAGQTPMTSTEAVRTFKACTRPHRPGSLDCSAEFVENVVRFYDRGEQWVLRPLLDAGLSSDGFLSEQLGIFFSRVISKNPRRFLVAIAWRSKKAQSRLCWLAGAEDGGGMEKETLFHVRKSLHGFVRQGNSLRAAASICLNEINRVNVSAKR